MTAGYADLAALDATDAQIAVWESVVRDANENIAALRVSQLREIGAVRHPAARFLHLQREAGEDYRFGGMFAADGRDMIDGTANIDGIDPDNDVLVAIAVLPSGAVPYSREAQAYVIELPGGPPRCTRCNRTEDEDDSCPDHIFGRHCFE